MGVKLAAASGGSIELVPTNTASSFTVTVPAVTATVLTDSAGILNIGSGQIYKDASGNVGIGTSSPAAKLDIISATNNGISVSDGTYTGTFVPSSLGGMAITTGGAYPLIYYINGAERARIDSSGNLLVGTTSQVLSNTKFNLSSAQGTALGGMGFVNTNAPSIKWQIGPDSSANFVVFNGSAVGAYIANGGTSWTAYSDERLKTTLVPFENASAKVATFRAGTGRYLTDEPTVSRSFLIAQDVQKVLPEAVDANNPDALGLSYTDVIPLLVAAIQEQQALIVQLQADVAALKGAQA